MKKTLFFIALFSNVFVAIAHTLQESYGLVSLMMDRMCATDEWSDCVSIETNNASIDIVYPTAMSLFESLSNSVYGAWSLDERKDAFNAYVESLSHTNKTIANNEYKSTGSYALMFCEAKNYTNVLRAAKSIVMARDAPCKESALSVVLKFSSPSVELNNLILSVATNSNDYLRFTCYKVVNDYFEKLTMLHGDDWFVATNAASLFYGNRDKLLNLFATDKMLKFVYPTYSVSTNRFLLATTALARPDLTSIEQAYFVSVTNSLYSVTQPLAVVLGL